MENNNWNRILIIDDVGILKELRQSPKYKKILKKFEVWSIDDFKNKIKDTEHTLFYACGHEFYVSLREMNDDGTLHLGLRNFNYLDFMLLEFVYIGSNRLIYDNCKEFYKYEAPEGRKQKEWFFDKSLLDENAENARPRLEYFLSDECTKDYLKYPKTVIVGLKEGKEVLHKLDKYTVHKYDTTVGYDWYRNPENRVWENEFGFDFETSNKYGHNINKNFPEFYGTKATGFALSWCEPHTDEPKAIFFDFRLDYGYDEDKWENNPKYKKEYYEFLEVMKSFFDHHYKHIWSYNSSFEYAMLFTLLRKFYPIQDSYALCIADDMRGSLKFNTQYYLRSPSWDDELDADFEYFDQICNTFKTFEDFEEYEEKYYRLKSNNENLNIVTIKEKIKEAKKKEREIKKEICKKFGWKLKDDSEEIEEKFSMTKTYDKLQLLNEQLEFYADLDKKDPRFIEAMCFFSRENDGKRMLLKQYWGNSWGASGVLENHTEYGTKETNCLGLYCGIDAFVGERLGRLLMPAYGNNCYQEILRHRYIAAELKMCGIKVDKKRLLELYRFCINALNNYELSSNIFYQKLLLRHMSSWYGEIYNGYDDFQKNFINRYGSSILKNHIYSVDTFIIGRDIIREYIDEYELKDDDLLNPKELFKWLNSSSEWKDKYVDKYDIEFYTVNDFETFCADVDEENSNFDFIYKVGKTILNRLNFYDIAKQLNEFSLGIIKPKYDEYFKQVKPYWILEDKLPLNKTFVEVRNKRFEIARYVSLFEIVEDLDKSTNQRYYKKYFEQYFDDDDLENLKILPSEMSDKLDYLIEINDSWMKKHQYDDICTIIPKIGDIFDQELYQDLPSFAHFIEYVEQLKLQDSMDNDYGDISVGIIDPLLDKDGNRVEYPKETMIKYFSPQQIDEYYANFVSNWDYYDYGKAIRSVANCFKVYCKENGIENNDIAKTDPKNIWKAMLSYLNNDNYRDLINNTPEFSTNYIYYETDTEEQKEEYDWFGKVDKETNFSKLDTKYTQDSWATKDALENAVKVYKVIPHLFKDKHNIYTNFKIDGEILPDIANEIIEEYPSDQQEHIRLQLSMLWDLLHQGFIRRLAQVCNKLVTMYIPALDMGYVKYPYKENLDESGKDLLYGQWEEFEEYKLTNIMNESSSLYNKGGFKYLFTDDCENWWLHEVPDMWCLPPYKVNSAISKRNSSPKIV